MIDALYLYDREAGLFKAILNASKTMQGRYHVVSSSFDIDTTDMNGITEQKYPCVVCAVPNVGRTANHWIEYTFTLYFLTRYAHSPDGNIKDVDVNTLISRYPSWHDWNDMEHTARNFYGKLRQLLRENYVSAAIRWGNGAYIVKAGNDIVNGFRLSFTASVSDLYCDFDDYEAAEITVPPFEI